MDDVPTVTGAAKVSPSEIESGLIEIWRRKLRVESIANDDNFFDLGGDSVLAIEMLLEVECEFDKEPPLSLLASGLTIARLAAWLETGNVDFHTADDAIVAELDGGQEVSHSPVLVPLRAKGAKPPVFLVHGVGLPGLRGDLIEHLDPDQPVYMFQHRGLDGKTAPNETIEDMAADYIAAMRMVQPAGPYFLGGFCAGSIGAMEMAHQLVSDGESVPMVFLVDPPHILHAFVGRLALLRYAKRGSLFLLRKVGKMFDRRNRHKWKEWKARMDEESSSNRGSTGAARTLDHEGVRNAQESFIRAMRKYRPKPYHGIIHYVCPSNEETVGGPIEEFWTRAYPDVRVERIGRVHHDVYGDDLPLTARHLQRCLDEGAL